MANGLGLNPQERTSIILNGVVLVMLLILAGVSIRYNWSLFVAVSVGGLGGLVHEFAQSGGRIIFFQRHQDGLYLGSLAGVVLGAAAGILVVRGHLTISGGQEAIGVGPIQLSYEIFFAALGLKGITEAAGGSAVPFTPPPPAPPPPSPPPQP